MARKDKEQSFPASKPDGFYSGPDSYYSKADDYKELNYEDLEGVAGGIKLYSLDRLSFVVSITNRTAKNQQHQLHMV